MTHWLAQYATGYHQWRELDTNGQKHLYRPLGLVETAFDTDGLYFEGRADITVVLHLEVNSTLHVEQFRRKITLAWTVLRLHHVLLMAKAVHCQHGMAADITSNSRFFLITPPETLETAIDQASNHIVFLEDHRNAVDLSTLFLHSQNAARICDASQAMAKLLVLPLERTSSRKSSLKLLFFMAHQICDGVTSQFWMRHFLELVNTPLRTLETSVSALSSLPSLRKRLPSAQEDLYPQIIGSKTRQRWFWALSVVLRHVKKPMPAAFPNPLRRDDPATFQWRLNPDYQGLLDYSKSPPTITLVRNVAIGEVATRRLHRLCRETGTSIGAGCFVLTAMAMMALHEARYPDIPLEKRDKFIGSFPINPRSFFNHQETPNSMMLAFSDGVVLPFLPSDLDLDGRFRLLVRQATKQLALYQKRKKPAEIDIKAYMGSRGAGRMTAMNYISAVERMRAKLPEDLKDSLGLHSPQGQLAVQPNPTMATCGISSVGKSSWEIGRYDVDADLPDGEDAFVADFRGMGQNVRARDGEFLVGIGGSDHSIGVGVSYDAGAIDERLVDEWAVKMQTLLLPGPPSKL